MTKSYDQEPRDAEITDEMIDAGVMELSCLWNTVTAADTARAVFRAMLAARTARPPLSKAAWSILDLVNEGELQPSLSIETEGFRECRELGLIEIGIQRLHTHWRTGPVDPGTPTGRVLARLTHDGELVIARRMLGNAQER